jgi:hypothetical protein
MVKTRKMVGVALVLLAAWATVATITHTLDTPVASVQVAEASPDTQTNGFSGYMVAVG